MPGQSRELDWAGVLWLSLGVLPPPGVCKHCDGRLSTACLLSYGWGKQAASVIMSKQLCRTGSGSWPDTAPVSSYCYRLRQECVTPNQQRPGGEIPLHSNVWVMGFPPQPCDISTPAAAEARPVTRGRVDCRGWWWGGEEPKKATGSGVAGRPAQAGPSGAP